MRIKPYEVPGQVARHAFLLVASVLFMVPFYVAIVNVFKTRADIIRAPMSIPWSRLTLDNITRNLFAPHFNVLIGYGTSLFIAALTVSAVVVLGSVMSYVLCRKKQRFFQYAYLLLLAGLMIPAQVILLPIVQVLRHLHLMFTVWGLLLMNVGWYLPFAAFLFVGYMRTVSPQFDESARMDGASDRLPEVTGAIAEPEGKSTQREDREMLEVVGSSGIRTQSGGTNDNMMMAMSSSHASARKDAVIIENCGSRERSCGRGPEFAPPTRDRAHRSPSRERSSVRRSRRRSGL